MQAITQQKVPFELMLGVYLESGDPGEINNENVSLYYKNKELTTGDHQVAKLNEAVFDLDPQSVLIHTPDDDKWFYYGIDTSWATIATNQYDLDIIDSSNWKLCKNS